MRVSSNFSCDSQEKSQESLPFVCKPAIIQPFFLTNSATSAMSLPFLIETVLTDPLKKDNFSQESLDFEAWVRVPQALLKGNSRKPRDSLPNFKEIVMKSKVFSSEFARNLHQTASLGKGNLSFVEFKRFYEELDHGVNFQRVFHYFNKCNEFVLKREVFEEVVRRFAAVFKKTLKSNNLIIESLLRKHEKIEELRKDVLFGDYVKMVAEFKNSLSRVNSLTFFENDEKVDKKKFIQTLSLHKNFPLVYLFEFLRLEKVAIAELEKENRDSAKNKGIIKKFLMNEVKKTLKKCDFNGDLCCSCSFCKWF